MGRGGCDFTLSESRIQAEWTGPVEKERYENPAKGKRDKEVRYARLALPKRGLIYEPR